MEQISALPQGLPSKSFDVQNSDKVVILMCVIHGKLSIYWNAHSI